MLFPIQLPYYPDQVPEQMLTLTFLLMFLIQMIYLWGVFSKLAFRRKEIEVRPGEAVSVVICARNEYHNLKNNLPLLFKQDYPEFEIVVVNDNSQDESLELLEDLAREEDKLKIVNLSQDLNFFRGKKFPLSLGIKSASHDIILLTDADCYPASDQWIKNMAGHFRDGKDIVLGYGAYAPRNSMINMLIRYETLWTAISYLSFAMAGKAYMGVGRNMAYRKSLFYSNKGFSSHYTVASGDDDLFVNSVATKNNVAVELDADSHTRSIPKTRFSDWVRQKRRHFTTWKFYKRKFKWLLGAWTLSQAFFMAALVVMLVLKFNLIIALSAFLIRIVSYLLITKLCMNRLNEKKLLVFSPIAELFLMVFYPVLSLVNAISKPDKWK